MNVAKEPSGAVRRSSRRGLFLVLGCALAGLAGLAAWLWEDLTFDPSVYVVGDSITFLSQASISSELSSAGYQATIKSTPGVKIGQAQDQVAALARQQPWAWIIELGTNDAGAQNTAWPEPFLAEWSLVSPAQCVIYVTVSPRAGAIARQINAAMARIARVHTNAHLLEWGTIEYENPTWVTADGIHPTPAGQEALAVLEAQALRHSC